MGPDRSDCSIDGCSAPARTQKHGWCTKHHRRWQRHGSPHTLLRTPDGEAQAWLDEHLSRESYPDECIEWPYIRAYSGHALIPVERRNTRVSRIVLESDVGPPPDGKDFALHSCDNPPCVNPRHLRWGDNAENMRDLSRRGGTYGNAVLTEDDVREIRRRYAEGDVTQEALGEEYGVTGVNIGLIVRRKTWTHVE